MSDFKIAAGQVASVRGNIARKIATHAAAIETAVKHGASVLVFPELSLTGYRMNQSIGQIAIVAGDYNVSNPNT